jgi:hypothetical protein
MKIQSSDLIKGGSNQLLTGSSAKLILTVYYQGKLTGNMSKKLDKEELHKIKTSPFERLAPDGKGYITPKNLYLSPSDFTPRSQEVVKRKTTISEKVYYDWIFGGIPGDYNKKKEGIAWEKASERFKIEYYLNGIAEGNPYKYEIID